MTEQTQPTDAELLAVWDSYVGDPTAKLPLTNGDKLAFARIVLSRWGTPAGAGEVVAYLHKHKHSGMVDLSLRRMADNDFNRARWECIPLSAPAEPQPTQAQTREPLTVQYPEGYGNPLAKIAYDAGWRAAEHAHGIKGADHGQAT